MLGAPRHQHGAGSVPIRAPNSHILNKRTKSWFPAGIQVFLDVLLPKTLCFCVGLSADLHKNYRTDFHQPQMDDGLHYLLMDDWFWFNPARCYILKMFLALQRRLQPKPLYPFTREQLCLPSSVWVELSSRIINQIYIF